MNVDLMNADPINVDPMNADPMKTDPTSTDPSADVASAEDGAAERTAGRVEPSFWQGRRVLLTGHTGFKGAWLALWLQSLGAQVCGFANGVPTEPSLYELARVEEDMQSVSGDIRDPAAIVDALAAAQPRDRDPHGGPVAGAPLLRGSARDI